MRPARLTCSLAILCTLAVGAPVWAQDVPAVDFDAEVAPLLARRCLDCHAGTGAKGRLDLTRQAGARAGGRGGPAVVPGNPADSPLWQHVESGHMPPKQPLPAAEKALLKRWIAAGAPWGVDPIDPYRATTATRAGYDWWSLQPVRRPALPPVTDGWGQNPIDAFVLARLQAASLRPAPPADRRTLIRRLTFDLHGLPPTPAEVDAFLADEGPTAYEAVVDRLLASPRYGERWARHWLDVVRFGESNGFEHDEIRPAAWPYRDWVISALNRDLPYDVFARLQLAGDVLAPDDPGAVTATGFLVAGPLDTVGQAQQSAAMKAVVRQDELEDIVGAVSQTFLGLTVQCARCHDHKFDPVRQAEYYRLTAALAGVRHGERDLPPAGARARAYAVVPRPPEATYVLLRGEPGAKGPAVAPGGIAALRGPAADFGLADAAPDGARRRALADYIASPRNPLFARVMVNRLWHHHFGSGIVDTPSDFGFSGGRPSHPELLDWLAAEFVGSGWSLKAMHRLIVTSAAYRQQSRFAPAAARADAGNRLLWRKSPARLEAEAARDAMLATAGLLGPTMGGPGYQDFQRSVRGATHFYTPTEDDATRRSVYRTWARGGRDRLLDALDCPDPSTLAPRRAVTTTPLQALALLNNPFVLGAADAFAARVQREAGDGPDRQVGRAYALAFGRAPTAAERAAARPVVERHGLPTLCRAIFNSNEFLYID